MFVFNTGGCVGLMCSDFDSHAAHEHVSIGGLWNMEAKTFMIELLELLDESLQLYTRHFL